ncbi:MAG: glycoside hydrolase family 25 protein [Anaerolineales bacterium]|nr:glycoside hydrolase family 25 protein [Anaerolineales bacterium]
MTDHEKNFKPTPIIQPQPGQVLNRFKLPDVSFWQDDPTTPQGIRFQRMAEVTRGVIIRAGQGTFEDKVFKTSWKNARQAGLVRGSYWFYDSRVNPKRQAEKWVEVLGSDTGEMEMWCDFEDRYGGPFTGWRHWFDFMERIKALLPQKQLGIYTGYYYWMEFAPNVTYFAQYPLWIAWYNPQEPLIPPIWQEWLYWQFTSNGDGGLYGVESLDIDLNYFKGTEEEFLARYPKPPGEATVIAKFGNTLVEYRRVS